MAKRKTMKKKIDLTRGNILKKLLVVAAPMLLTSLVQMAYNLTDMYWVAQVDRLGLNPNVAVAAVGTAGFYTWLGFGLILIAKVGTSVRVSQAAGKNDAVAVNRIAVNGLVLMLALAFVYTVYGVFFGNGFFSLFDFDDPRVDLEGVRYMRIVSAFGVAYFAVNLFNGVYDGLGKTINTFYITASGLLLNMVLDPIFILTFGMGVSGAAWATGISQSFVLLTYVVVYLSRYRPAVLRLGDVSIRYVRNLFTLGLPVGVQSMVMAAISMMLGVMVARVGGTQMTSVASIGSQIEALSWMVASGFQIALAAFVGQNYGAGNMERIRRGYRQSMMLLIPYGLAVNALLLFAARPLFALFIDTEPTLSAGIVYLRILSISQLFMILELVTAGAFNGLGRTYAPSTIQFGGNLIRIPLALALVALMQSVEGIWWALTISSVIKGVLLVTLFLHMLRTRFSGDAQRAPDIVPTA